jgi:alkanesulfonate monooxygenase SsuD/methylene tetrahydromethanopterin reductase-like flavin-dependent oxidoreductase (luciferase family)
MPVKLPRGDHQFLAGQGGNGGESRRIGAIGDESVSAAVRPEMAKTYASKRAMSEADRSAPHPSAFVCTCCASPRITREAWAAWDVPTQRWVLAELFDYAFCHRCHRRVALNERAVD